VKLDMLGAEPRALAISADAAERQALAKRFGLLALDSLEAELGLIRDGEIVSLTGRLRARATQACVATGAPVAAAVDEPIALRFRPASAVTGPDEEIELDEGELDILFHDGAAVDAGEAVAQSLALALEPYPRAPDAEAALRQAGVKSEDEAGPFAALAALKKEPSRE
jgi:uncharacterized metal-binding protein YceD (DUF177 family)